MGAGASAQWNMHPEAGSHYAAHLEPDVPADGIRGFYPIPVELLDAHERRAVIGLPPPLIDATWPPRAFKPDSTSRGADHADASLDDPESGPARHASLRDGLPL